MRTERVATHVIVVKYEVKVQPLVRVENLGINSNLSRIVNRLPDTERHLEGVRVCAGRV